MSRVDKENHSKPRVSASLILPPNASAGVTFGWSDDKLIAKSFVNPEGMRARKAGIKVGMFLVSINGKDVDGWSFADICGVMKNHAKNKRVLQFAASVVAAPSPPKTILGLGEKNQVPDKHSESLSHSDPLSTPSRRRRVYLEAARDIYLGYKTQGIQLAVKSIIELQAIRSILPMVRYWLARKRWAFVIKAKRARAVLRLQNIARTKAAKTLLAKMKKTAKNEKERIASVFIQSLVRSSIAARETEHLRQSKKLHQLQQKSVLILQNSTRKLLSRIAVTNKIEKEKTQTCVLVIQCAMRQYLARKQLLLRRQQFISSIIIQSIWRKETVKKETKHLKKMKSIHKIQKVMRRKWVSFGIMKQVAIMKEEKQLLELRKVEDENAQRIEERGDDSVVDEEDQDSRLAQSPQPTVCFESVSSAMEFPLSSPCSSSLHSAHSVNSSPIGSPLSPLDQQRTLEQNAVIKIQNRARIHIRNRQNLSARIIAKLFSKFVSARRAVQRQRLAFKSVIQIQCWCRRIQALRKTKQCRMARLQELRRIMDQQFATDFYDPFRPNDYQKEHKEEEEEEVSPMRMPREEEEEETDQPNDFWRSLNNSIPPGVACMLRRKRLERIHTWDIPLTSIGPWLSHWKSDMYEDDNEPSS